MEALVYYLIAFVIGAFAFVIACGIAGAVFGTIAGYVVLGFRRLLG